MSHLQRVIVAGDQLGEDCAETSGALTDVERSVVQLSLKDERSSVKRSASLPACHDHFGLRKSKRLASPRLEALRCYLVLFRLTGGLRDIALQSALRDAGYTDPQREAAEQLVRQLQPEPIADRHASARRVGIVALIAFVSVGCVVIGRATQDATIAAVIVGVVLVSFMSLFSGRTN